MKLEQINIRDPYILLHEDIYYLYGTRAHSCWGKADGFDCYTSQNLSDWDGPFEIFKRPDSFWADQNFWAPECIYYQNKFYLITTFGSETHKGIQILVSDCPKGPFVPVSDGPVTPADWNCIDGTIYFDEKPYLIFSHSFEDVREGDMCIMELSHDLLRPVSEIKTLFSAATAPWACPIPFAKHEFGIDGDVYFTDGPALHKLKNGKLSMLWSSWSENGYAVGQAVSDSGKITGPWRHLKEKIFKQDGGHGMIFTTKEGITNYTLHYPNDKCKEHPVIFELGEDGDLVKLK